MTENSKCNLCKFYDCGNKCSCDCHFGSTPKIRIDNQTETQKKLQEKYEKSREEESMEGLSSLFG